LELPIKTPNYHTTAVRLNSMQLIDGQAGFLEFTVAPCVVRILNGIGEPLEATADVTWQGFEKEYL
jgi:hypothetical protein